MSSRRKVTAASPVAPASPDPTPASVAIHCRYDRLVAPTDLRFNPANNNHHPPDQIALLSRLYQETGIRHPVIVSTLSGMVVAGEGRARAGLLIPGCLIPVVDQPFNSEAEELSFLLADNRLQELSDRDETGTAAVLARIKANNPAFNILTSGYSEKLIDRLLKKHAPDTTEKSDADPEPPIDRAAELLKKWNVIPGDIFSIGAHRLMCGDSTSAASVEALMADSLADLVFTSPPYDQQREYRDAATQKVKDWNALMNGVFANIIGTEKCQVLVNLGLVHREGEWIPYWEKWIEWMRQQSWQRFGWYVWDQGFGLPGDWNGRLAPSHEFIFHFNRVAEKARKTVEKKPENIKKRRRGASTMRAQDGTLKKFSSPEASAQETKIADSVIRVRRQQGRIGENIDHPAVFPVDFAAVMLQSFSDAGGIIYEPFNGSGTTMVAAQYHSRGCYGMEISPGYCAVTLERMAAAFPGIPIQRL
jgi:DNA modification methylase